VSLLVMLAVRLVIVTSFPSGEITGPVYKFRSTRWELGVGVRGGVLRGVMRRWGVF
jgi:hypothetical protein